MNSVDLTLPLDAHVYDLWANGGIDPWPSSDLRSARGTFLCYGPRGCGKTFLAQVFFQAAGKTVIQLSGVDVLKNPDKQLSRVMRDAVRADRSGLLVEDIDSLLVNLRSSPSAWQFFVQNLKHPAQDFLIFATATWPEKLEAAELDAFKFVLPVFYGDEGLREVIMVTHAGDVALDPDVDLREIAQRTEWWSAQELMELIRTAPLESRGFLTRDALLAQLNQLGSNIVGENRARRMHELLEFTASNCTSQWIREEIKYRFGPEYLVPAEKVPPTINIGELHVEHQELNIKQAGVVVSSGGQASGFIVNQTLTEAMDKLDLEQLQGELAVLIKKLSEEKEAVDKTESIAALTQAQTEVKEKQRQNVFKSLAKVGKGVLDVAKEIGTTVAAKAITMALGLESKA